tara:strand:- start:785 stop:1102 length:318 start_codon:yes stop_codon:yes gene_type:complete
MIIFISLLVIYLLVSIGLVRLYFYLQGLNQKKRDGTFVKLMNSYLLFAFFVLISLPFTIFFPAWLSEKLEVVERTPDTTMYFILFGCFVLAIAIWKGRIPKQNEF